MISNSDISKSIVLIRQLRLSNPREAEKQLNILLASLKYLVHSVAYHYIAFPNYDDIFQEGMLGLASAIEKYDTSTTFHFARYALWWIKTKINRSIKKELKPQLFSDTENPNLEDEVISSSMSKSLEVAVNSLSLVKSKIIKSKYGLNCKPLSTTAISKLLSIKFEDILSLEKEALSDLKSILNF